VGGKRLGLSLSAAVPCIDPARYIRNQGARLPEMSFTLTLLPIRLAICRLAPQAAVPAWATAGEFFSITRTAEELSIVCMAPQPSATIPCDRGWRALKLEGPFPLEAVGILAAVVGPLAEIAVSVFALATYDTDYLLVKETQLARAIAALSAQGHTVQENIPA